MFLATSAPVGRAWFLRFGHAGIKVIIFDCVLLCCCVVVSSIRDILTHVVVRVLISPNSPLPPPTPARRSVWITYVKIASTKTSRTGWRKASSRRRTSTPPPSRPAPTTSSPASPVRRCAWYHPSHRCIRTVFTRHRVMFFPPFGWYFVPPFDWYFVRPFD